MALPREHWDGVYRTKADNELSWHQERPQPSLALIRSYAPTPNASVIDVGGGTSVLAENLLGEGYSDIAVLDISAAALERSRSRLSDRAAAVTWIAADVANWTPPRTWDVWHDRAVFHFLTDLAAQEAYVGALKAATHPGAAVIIATFAMDGPERCSGLPVQRYSGASLAARLGADFSLRAEEPERHATPWGAGQNFTYAVFRRLG
jgi:2-polyprenyl-3-methyl-5-hydroxy-6-metoxy-1,4-benzoquinol methylase